MQTIPVVFDFHGWGVKKARQITVGLIYPIY